MADRRRWTVLAAGTFAQAATCSFLYGTPMLLPQLKHEGVPLLRASLLVSAPIAGILLTLIAWGALADRLGERIVIAAGVGGSAIALVGAALAPGTVGLGLMFVVAGALAGSVNAASGRMVMGWFPRHERGLAMGTRQTAQPVGVALAALGLPPLAHDVGVHHAMFYPAALCAASAVLVLVAVIDPPRPPAEPGAARAGSPYRRSTALARVHLSSALLVVPQFAIGSFTLIYLVDVRHWDATTAGRVVFWFQVAGAVGRVASGVWSDRVRSRLSPMRQLAVASAALMGVVAVGAATGSWIVVAGLAVGAVITVADNGLAYTSVAEFAGQEWSGRALGVQNTVQNLVAMGTTPMLAAVIGDHRYGWGFALAALFPLAAILATPVRAEREHADAERRPVAAAETTA